MSARSDQAIITALQRAAADLALPPESRWIRERRPARTRNFAYAVAAAVLALTTLAVMLNALRAEPRVAPAQPDAFAAREDAEWARLRSEIPPALPVLRPTYVPSQLRGSPECPSPTVRNMTSVDTATAPTVTARYEAIYLSDRRPNGTCGRLFLAAQSGMHDLGAELPSGYRQFSAGGPADIGSMNARGTVLAIRQGRQVGPDPLQSTLERTFVWWNENGATYEVYGDADVVSLEEIVRIIRSLEPVR